MNHFCTLFDSNYLSRALALYQSLCKQPTAFHLHCYCFDQNSYQIMQDLKLDKVSIYAFNDWETYELLNVKPTRTKTEYCWTSTPFIIFDCLTKNKSIAEVTYLDADLYFFNDPQILFNEFNRSQASILLSPHNYAVQYQYKAQISGIYCVQFLTFKKDQYGLAALDWWKARCLEWCYNRVESGLFGDQKYLDDWTSRFAKVYVLAHQGAGVAPWNQERYQMTYTPQGLAVDDDFIIFYHFHRLLWQSNNTFDLSDYPLSDEVEYYCYRPYIKALEQAEKLIQTVAPHFTTPKTLQNLSLQQTFTRLKRTLKNKYRVIDGTI